MKFNEIVSISGLSGLHRVVSTKPNGMVVTSLDDNKTKFVPNRQHTFTSLENISVYTNDNNTKPLKEVLHTIKNYTGEIPEAKANDAAIKNFFNNIVPDYDKDQVYLSDMKKVVKWFGLLKNYEGIFENEDAEVENKKAPKEGLKEKAEEVVEDIREAIATGREKIIEAVEDVKEAVQGTDAKPKKKPAAKTKK